MRFRPSRRALIIAGAAFGALVVIVVLGLWVIYPWAGAKMVRDKVVPRLEAKLGREVTIGAVEVDHGRAVLRDVRVFGPSDGAEPLVRIDRVDVDFDFWASVVGSAEVGKVV